MPSRRTAHPIRPPAFPSGRRPRAVAHRTRVAIPIGNQSHPCKSHRCSRVVETTSSRASALDVVIQRTQPFMLPMNSRWKVVRIELGKVTRLIHLQALERGPTFGDNVACTLPDGLGIPPGLLRRGAQHAANPRHRSDIYCRRPVRCINIQTQLAVRLPLETFASRM